MKAINRKAEGNDAVGVGGVRPARGDTRLGRSQSSEGWKRMFHTQKAWLGKHLRMLSKGQSGVARAGRAGGGGTWGREEARVCRRVGTTTLKNWLYHLKLYKSLPQEPAIPLPVITQRWGAHATTENPSADGTPPSVGETLSKGETPSADGTPSKGETPSADGTPALGG